MSGGRRPGRGVKGVAAPRDAHPTFLQRHLHHDSVVGLGGASRGLGVFPEEGAAVLGDAGAGAQGAAQRGRQVAAQGVGRRQAGPDREGEQPLFGLLAGQRALRPGLTPDGVQNPAWDNRACEHTCVSTRHTCGAYKG